VTSPVEIARDAKEAGSLKGFTTQPMEEAEQTLTGDITLADEVSGI
jgi:hypothetical protein